MVVLRSKGIPSARANNERISLDAKALENRTKRAANTIRSAVLRDTRVFATAFFGRDDAAFFRDGFCFAGAIVSLRSLYLYPD
jgi:hypothetical protein